MMFSLGKDRTKKRTVSVCEKQRKKYKKVLKTYFLGLMFCCLRICFGEAAPFLDQSQPTSGTMTSSSWDEVEDGDGAPAAEGGSEEEDDLAWETRYTLLLGT